MNAVTHFSGGGGTAWGLRSAGCTLASAVEYDAQIAEHYALNLGPNITVSKVEDVDFTPYIGIDFYSASPVCTRASVANVNGEESELDMTAALAVIRFIRTCRPRIVMIENVWQYRRFKSCQLILDCLFEEGYFTSVDHVNAADFGVSQTRKRMIIRALRDCPVPPLPKPEPWIGWYEAIEDLIPSLPESQFAPWQLARLPKEHRSPAASPSISAAGERCPTIRGKDEPAFTLKTSGWGRVHRAFLCGVNGEGSSCLRDSIEPSPTIVKDHGAASYRAFVLDGQTNSNGKDMTLRTDGEPMFTISASADKRPARALLLDNGNTSRSATCRTSQEPCFTLTQANSGRRNANLPQALLVNESSSMEMRQAAGSAACQVSSERNTRQKGWLETGRVVAMTPRTLARFQSFPDAYILPEKNSLAATIIGNAVPPLLAEKIARQLIEAIS